MRLCGFETETHDASPWAQLGMAAVQPNTLCRNPFAAKSQHLAAPEFSRTQCMPCARFLPSSAAGACHAAKAVSQRYWEWVTGAVHSRASTMGAQATCRGGGGARGRGSAGHRGANAAASRRPPHAACARIVYSPALRSAVTRLHRLTSPHAACAPLLPTQALSAGLRGHVLPAPRGRLAVHGRAGPSPAIAQSRAGCFENERTV